jgi:hypothetical protein
MKQHAIGFAVILLALGLVFGLVWTTPASADNLYASIRGTVTDPAGAVMPDAKLTAKNVATGLSYTVTSNKDGLFAFLQLPIGDYEVVVEKAGFKTFMEGHIHLDLDQIFTLKVAMELGVVTDTITVEANPAQVETTSMQLGTVVTGKQIVDLPLNGRNWTQLMQLEPGVQASSDRFGAGAYSTNGSETQQNSFLLNGTDSNDAALNVPLVVPSPDSIGEFSLVTSTLNPEYGRNSGAVVNAAIKSGTNQFHGDVFEFYRDTFLDAKSWFEKTPSPFHQNQFGGTVGGPVIKDHMFFFFSYQGTKNRIPQGTAAPTVFSGTGTVGAAGTTGERGGDFTADSAFSSNPIPFAMYGDDLSTCPVSGGVMCQPGGASSFYNQMFSTGTVPIQDFNPLSVKLANQYVPAANTSGNRFTWNPITTGTDQQYIYRIDQRITQRDSLFFYQLYEKFHGTSEEPFSGSNLPGFTATNPTHVQEYTVGWNHTFTPTTLNELRVAYLRLNFAANIPVSNIDPTAYGFSGISVEAPAYESLPTMNLNGLFEIGFSNNGPQPRVQNTYQLTDNFSKVWGHHTFKAGINFDVLQINNPFYNVLDGNYTFNHSGAFSTGIEQADFLLGVPDNFNQGSGSIIRGRGREYYSYVQDQWQVQPSLTVTLGAGWDIETPWRNLFAGGEIMSQFIPGEQSTVFPTAPVGLVFPGDRGVNQYGGPTVHYDDLAPRLGFAWSPGGSHKMSIRAGVGLYYNRSEQEVNLQTLTNAPFALSASGTAFLGVSPNLTTPYNTANAAPVGTIPCANATGSGGCSANPNPFPFSPPAKGATNINWSIYEPLGFGTVVSDPHLTAPRVTNFNLTFQYQLDKATIMSLGYVGALGRHEQGAYDNNQPGIATGNPVAAAAGCTSDFALPFCAPQTFPFNPSIYGQFGVYTTDFNNNYNALQGTIKRNFSNGLGFAAAYTWSRNFDYTSNFENSAFNAPGINILNVNSMYAPSANDAPQRLVVNYTYTLPFYKLGHHWRRLTDDWTLTGITTLQHGFPVAVWDANFGSLTSGGGFYSDGFFAPLDRPNQVSSLHYGNPRNNTINGLPNSWFNPAVFAEPTIGVQGTSSRNPIYGPGINFTDLALEKSIHIDETRYLQLRMETFDTFNHANFGTPGNAFGTSTFGQISSVQSISTNGDGRVVQLGLKVYF